MNPSAPELEKLLSSSTSASFRHTPCGIGTVVQFGLCAQQALFATRNHLTKIHICLLWIKGESCVAATMHRNIVGTEIVGQTMGIEWKDAYKIGDREIDSA